MNAGSVIIGLLLYMRDLPTLSRGQDVACFRNDTMEPSGTTERKKHHEVLSGLPLPALSVIAV